MRKNAADRLLELVAAKKNPAVVGLDPVWERIPEEIKKSAAAEAANDPIRTVAKGFLLFNKMIIDAVKDIVPAVKPQFAFYEQYGSAGIEALEETMAYARQQGLVVIGDGKRNDIGSTARAYAAGYLGKVSLADGSLRPIFDGDFLTVNPYLGTDGIEPFLAVCREEGKGIFVLVKTSNPSSGELQDILDRNGEALYENAGKLVARWGQDLTGEKGYSAVGAVVAATYAKEAVKLREIMPDALFLVPGYGAQGGTAADVVPCFNEDGYGAVVNASRSIIYAYQSEAHKRRPAEFHLAAAEAALAMQEELYKALKQAGKLPAGW